MFQKLSMALAIAVLSMAATARADGPMPVVMVGPVVIGGEEAEEMIDELAHHHHHHHYRAGDSLDWLQPTPVPPTPAPGMPTVVVGSTMVVGHEAEEMINKLSRMRHHGRYRAGNSLDWLGIPTMVPAPMMVPVAVMPMAPVPMPLVVPMVPAMVAPVVVMAPPAKVEEKKVEPDLSRTMIGLLAQGNTDHASMGLALAIEGRRWGVNANAAATIFHATSSDQRQTNFKLVDAHLMFAPFTGERGRISMELGAAAAFAKQAIMIGPDVGLSADLRIWGPLGILASMHGTFYPFTRWDVYGGAFAKLWIFRVEGGWREMRLYGDLKNGDGVCDRWSGPYVGATLVF